MISDHPGIIRSSSFIPAGYLVLFLYCLIVWVYRWLFAPRESRCLLLFATVFGAIVIAAVLNLEQASWMYLTVVGLWVAVVIVLLLLQRKEKRREDPIQLLGAIAVFSVALIAVVYGVNSYASARNQDLLGHLVMLSAVLALFAIRGWTSKPQSKEEEPERNRN